MSKYINYVEMTTDCTSDDPRYSNGSKIYGPVRYLLRTARGYREAGMMAEAASYLNRIPVVRHSAYTLKGTM